jgi:hypothetical protein
LDSNNLTEEEIKVLALSKLVEEEFTETQRNVMLVNLLMLTFNTDLKLFSYLEKSREKFKEIEFSMK